MTGPRATFVLVTWLAAAGLLALAQRDAVARSTPAPAMGHEQGLFAERSLAVYPPQKIPLSFDHRRHVGMGMSCVTCHAAARESERTDDRLLPSPTVCDRCHDADHQDENAVTGGACDLCHQGYEPDHGNRVARVVLPPANLRFDHRAHAVRNIACPQCHEGVAQRGLASRGDLPRMERCLDCHGMAGPAAGEARGECLVCHLSEDGRRMITRFESGTMVPPPWLRNAEHGPGWIERHRQVAATDSQFCSTCHEEQECVDCHDGRLRPRRIHPSDWISLHSTAARQRSTTCTSCHRQQSFCLSCHQRAGVTIVGPDARAQRGRFHPPPATWTDPPRGPGHHALEAQRNLDDCVGCHTERDCATCHATRAAGGTMPNRAGRVSPHPPGFANRCRGPLDDNARACLVCHLPGDGALAQCR